MKNVKYEISGSKLIIEVDLSKTFGPSSTGKTIIVASTEGFVSLDTEEPISLAVNVTKKK